MLNQPRLHIRKNKQTKKTFRWKEYIHVFLSKYCGFFFLLLSSVFPTDFSKSLVYSCFITSVSLTYGCLRLFTLRFNCCAALCVMLLFASIGFSSKELNTLHAFKVLFNFLNSIFLAGFASVPKKKKKKKEVRAFSNLFLLNCKRKTTYLGITRLED